jgi:predicted enzyme related to lactoylglutathione lyase
MAKAWKTRRTKRDPNALPHGKICYIEIPAVDVARSAKFYAGVFGWKIRRRGDGATAFDDATGYVSGAWVKNRPASGKPGALVYINVDSVTKSVKAVVARGGKIVQPIGVDAPEITARFADPAGNMFGLYQQPAPQPPPQRSARPRRSSKS